MFLLSQPQTLESYAVSPSFEEAEQRSFAAPLPAALPALKDAYLAYTGVLKSFRLGHTALFVYAAFGVGVSDIYHHCLSTIETAAMDPETEPQISFLVLLETMDCMVHRRKPTLRIQPRSSRSVDRYLGLCLPLLPYYYDLCVIIHTLASHPHPSLIVELQKQLDEVRALVDVWQPSQPEHFVRQFGSAEVIHLLAQARGVPIGGAPDYSPVAICLWAGDSQADIWSCEVLIELELAQRITQQSIRFVTLPFLVAVVEIRDPVARTKAVQNVGEYVDQFTPVVQKASKFFLSRVWRERGKPALWQSQEFTKSVASCRLQFSWPNVVHRISSLQ
jgi:hypothetical protein